MSNTIKINALKSKIEKLKKGMSAKAATETAKSKAKILIGKYEREIESLKVKPKKRGTKSAQTSVAKARILAAKRRAMQGLSTSKSDIEKDAQRPALPAGKRISKDGNTYYEYRENRIDRRPKKYARLEDGGEMMADGGVIEEGDVVLVKSEGLEAEVIRITNDNVVVEFINRRPDGGDKRGNYKLSQLKKMADGGEMMAKGGGTDIEMTAWKLPISYNKNKEVIYGEPIILKKGTEKQLLKFLDNEKYVKDNRDIFDGRSGVVMFPSTTTLEQVKKYHTYAYADGGEMMAKGGVSYGTFGSGRLNKNAWVSANYIGDSKVTLSELQSYLERNTNEKFDKDKIYTITRNLFQSGEYVIEDNKDWKESKIYRKTRMADGGEMMAFGGRTKSAIMRDRAYKSDEPHEQSYKRKSNPKNPRYNKYADGGEMHRSDDNSYSDGGMLEDMIDSGFTISKMRDYLRQRFPDSFGFYLARPDVNMLKYGLLKNEENTPLRGLTDEDINNSKIYFPQYKRDHEINFAIDQGGENTYFHFYLNDDEGTAYIGNFGFKDRGDVSPEYITSFIVFLMECYRLPIKVRHEAYGNGGMA
jgi:hypothetical protein